MTRPLRRPLGRPKAAPYTIVTLASASGGGEPLPEWYLPTTVGLTGAWAPGQPIVAGYAGSLVATSSGAISTLFDQSGAGRNLTQGSAAARPLLTTVNGQIYADFDGTDDFLGGSALSNFLAAGAGYAAFGLIPKSGLTSAQALIYNNRAIFGDNGGAYVGLYFESADGVTGTITGYNYDGTVDETAAVALPLDERVVVEWRHEGGNIYERVNGGSWTNAVASGNTQSLAGSLIVGASTAATTYMGMYLSKVAIYSTVPSAADQGAIVTGFLAR